MTPPTTPDIELQSRALMLPDDTRSGLQVRALTLPDEARAIIITDQDSYERAAAFLTERTGPLLREVDSVFDPVISAAHAGHKAALAAKAGVVTPIRQADTIVRHAIAGYVERQRLAREAEERRARDEQMRLEREAEAERKRLQEIADREHAEAVEREIEAAESRGADVGYVRQVAETPAPWVPPVYVAPAAYVPPAFAPVKGLATPERWTAEVTDLRQLCAEIAAGRQPVTLVEVRQAAIDALARTWKAEMKIPGLRAKRETGVRRTGR